MDSLNDVLRYTATGGFALLCVLFGRRWLIERFIAYGWLAVSTGLLAIVLGIGGASILGTETSPWYVLSRAAFLGSGVALMMVRHSFLPISRRIRFGVVAAAAVLAVLAGDHAPFYATRAEISGGRLFVAFGVVALWSGCVAEAVARFWSSSRSAARVQRVRLRLLSLAFVSGFVMVIGALVASTQGPTSTETLVGRVIVVGLLPVVYLSVVPPRWLRRAWREWEEPELREALEELLIFNPPERALARRALDWAKRLVDADGGFIFLRDEFVEIEGIEPAAAEGLIARAEGHSSAEILRIGDRDARLAVVVPLLMNGGALAVISNAFTPLFGSLEVERLQEYARWLEVALERVRLNDALRKQMERHGAVLRALDDLGQGVVIVDGDRIVSANDVFCAMTGYNARELADLGPFLDLFHPDHRPEVAHSLVAEAEAAHIESLMIHLDGSRIPVEMAVGRLAETVGGQTIVLTRNISRRRRREEWLRELTEAQGKFLARASHELRPPVMLVAALADVIASRGTDLTDERFDEVVDALGRQAHLVRSLIERFLDLSRLRAGHVRVATEEVRLRRVLEGALTNSAPPDSSTVTLDVDSDMKVVTDPVHVNSIVVNLLTNAYRYGGPNIRVEARAMGDRVVVCISDDGPGIAPATVDQIFEPFVRGENRAGIEGFGLGLATVKQLAGVLGTEVRYESGDPTGARFSFSLGTPAASSTTVNVVPSPTTERTVISPPIDRTSDAAMANPNPAPPGDDERAVDPR